MKRLSFFHIVVAFLVTILLIGACRGETQAPGGEDTSSMEPTAEQATEPVEEEGEAAEETGEEAEPPEEKTGDATLQTIQEKGVLVVGTSADYPPYESVDDQGNFVGFDMDLVREVGNRLGVEVEIQDMAFDALIASLQQGKIDVIIAAMQATPERDEEVDFTRAYNFAKDAFLVDADSDTTLNAATDVAGLNVGVQTGTAQERWVMENLVATGQMTEDKLFRYERADQAALDLAAGRIDVLIMIADAARSLAEESNLTIALETEETIAAGQAIAIQQGATELQAELDRILTELEEEGFITNLKEEHGIP